MRPGHQPGEPAAEDGDLDLILDRIAYDRRRMRVGLVEMREVGLDLLILMFPVVAQALVTLLTVPILLERCR